MKRYLLGDRLDSLNAPPYMKAKSREVFASHASYRSLLAPFAAGARCETAWLASWPPMGRQFLNFLESMIYATTAGEDAVLRAAVKNQRSEAEVSTFNLWAQSLEELQKAVATTAQPAQVPPRA